MLQSMDKRVIFIHQGELHQKNIILEWILKAYEEGGGRGLMIARTFFYD